MVARKRRGVMGKRRPVVLRVEELEGRRVPSTVTNLADAGPGSLRQAILDTPAGGTVDFQPGLSGTIILTGGELAIAKDLTIAGPGAAALTVSGNHASRVFRIDDPANAALSGLTIADGLVAGPGAQGGGIDNAGTLGITDCTIRDNIVVRRVYVTLGGGVHNAGTLTVTSSSLSGNAAGYGGGIANDGPGTLTVTSSTLSSNSAALGGGIYNRAPSSRGLTVSDSTFRGNSADSGGGICNFGTGTMTVTGSTFSRNAATGNYYNSGGGAIYNANRSVTSVIASTFSGNSAYLGGGILSANVGPLTVTASTFRGNTADASGGGIANDGPLTVTASTFDDNAARGNFTGMGGGGIYIENYGAGPATITASTFRGNTAAGHGGGIYCYNYWGNTLTVMSSTFSGNSAALSGGGIYNVGNSPAVTVLDSTFSGNAAESGGGIWNAGPLTLTAVTLSGNSARGSGGGIVTGSPGTLAVRNTIAAGNHAGASGPDLSGTVNSLGHNLVGDSRGASGFTDTDLLNVDPRLGPLQDNGGPTQTMALLPGSPAIGAGGVAGAAATDQRGPGYARVVQGRLDIGAFEVQAASTVTTTAADGPGSLRQAILDSNAAPGPNTIAFAIAPGGVQTILPTTALPAITQPVAIDGTTQPGYAGTPRVVLSGALAVAWADGLTVEAGHSTLRGLVVNGFGGRGVVLRGDANQVLGCYLGTDASGTVAVANGYGVDVTGAGNTVGGSDPGAGNLIAGNRYDGVYLEAGARYNLVRGNRIGTDASGTAPLGNEYGVLVSGDHNAVGGTARGAGNLISGNLLDGVALFGRRNVVRGNFIGTDVSGRHALGNGADGVFIGDRGRALANSIGGAGRRAANHIAFNGRDGVRVDDATGNAVLRNSIFANGHRGIELINGGNHDQAAPVLSAAVTGAGQVTVSGRLAGTPLTTSVLRFFSNPAGDPGQGRRYLGSTPVTTDAAGQATFTVGLAVRVPAGRYVTATATDPDRGSSPFAAPVAVTEGEAAGAGSREFSAAAGKALVAPVASQAPRTQVSGGAAALRPAERTLATWAELPVDHYFATASDEGLLFWVARRASAPEDAVTGATLDWSAGDDRLLV